MVAEYDVLRASRGENPWRELPGPPTYSAADPDTNKVFAPFDADQVESLTQYQRAGAGHAFVCPRHGEVLEAFVNGWCCPKVDCLYTQQWAWLWMADWHWQQWMPAPATVPTDPVVDVITEWLRNHAYAPDDFVLGEGSSTITPDGYASLHELLDGLWPDWRSVFPERGQ